MEVEHHPGDSPPLRSEEAEVVAYVQGRHVPCPRCTYDLRDITTAKCPECGEILLLKLGTPRPHFGWLVLAMAPGCFSGVAAMFLLLPIAMTIGRQFPPGSGMPWPLVGAEVFGFLSAASIGLMYHKRRELLSWDSGGQAGFAATIWGVHVMAFVLFVLAMAYWK